MTSRQKCPTFDDLLAAVDSLLDQIKILVAAVDDLRCEVEWQAKIIAEAESTVNSTAAAGANLMGEVDAVPEEREPEEASS